MKKNFIFICISIFFIISILTIYNATSILPSYLDNLYIKQIGWYLVGTIMVLLIIKIKNKPIKKYIWSLYIIFNFLLLFLLLFGTPINNAKCWFVLPFNLGTFQPSEFMKIILILVLASILDKQKLDRMSIKEELFLILKVGIIVLIPSILTFLEPDTGMVIIYFIIGIVMLFTSGIRFRWFVYSLVFITLIIIGIVSLYFLDKGLFVDILGTDFFLRIDRLLDWSNKTGYQLDNGIIAIGSGGLFGSGIKNIGVYFPEAQTDFVFASLANSLGFLGSLILLITILVFDIKLIKNAYNFNKYNKLVIAGVISILLYQQVQNIGMTLGLLPITGITLPFISYGGSSILSYLIIIGIIINIYNEKQCLTN